MYSVAHRIASILLLLGSCCSQDRATTDAVRNAVTDPKRELSADLSGVASSITGDVTVDSAQAQKDSLARATVTLTGPAPGTISQSVLTDESGHYEFIGLTRGTYALDLIQQGLQPWTATIVVGDEQTITQDITLRLSTVAQEVEVRAESSDISTQSSETNTTLSDRQLDKLPLAEQKFTSALPLVPGVIRTRDGKLNFKGQSESQGLLVVDSTENVDPVTGSFSIPIPIDTIQSMKVYNAPESAAFGGFSGGLTSIETKAPFDSWKYKLHDFIPGMRGKGGHLAGVADFTPRVQFGGPVIQNALNFTEEAEYEVRNQPMRGLAWPYNETKIRAFTSFTELQAILSPHHVLSTNVDVFPMRKQFADINALVPQSASSDYHQNGVSVSVSDANQLSSGGLLSTVLRLTRFDSDAHGQGLEDMQITPEGWGGNFFNAWSRTSNAFEAMPTLALPAQSWLGHHELRFGVDISHRSYEGTSVSHPVDLLRQDQSLAEQIDFATNGKLSGSDTEIAEFAEDQWSLDSHLALNIGARFSSQSIGREAAFGPHFGFSYTPGRSGRTVIRGSTALFYGHVPLLAADFDQNPTRDATFFNSAGAPIGVPASMPNICLRSGEYPASRSCADGTSPRTFTGSVEVEHEFSRKLLFRVNYLDSRTRSLSLISPLVNKGNGASATALFDTGGSRYHRAEASVRVRPSERSDLNLAYVWSRSRGDLNTLSDIFVPFEEPVIRPNLYGILASDVPHRFVSWGSFRIPGKFTLSPVADVRTGLPYSRVDVLQNYVGPANRERFPTFFSFDLKVYREFPLRIPFMSSSDKRKIRLGVYSLNLTNHFNPNEVYNSVASPQFGQFAGNNHRIGGFVIDIVD